MNIIDKIAKPCGIVGGVWGLLAPILVLLPITARGVTPRVTVEPGEQVHVLTRPTLGLGKEMVSMVEAGTAGDALPIPSFPDGHSGAFGYGSEQREAPSGQDIRLGECLSNVGD